MREHPSSEHPILARNHREWARELACSSHLFTLERAFAGLLIRDFDQGRFFHI
jgi:hypothetical protein